MQIIEAAAASLAGSEAPRAREGFPASQCCKAQIELDGQRVTVIQMPLFVYGSPVVAHADLRKFRNFMRKALCSRPRASIRDDAIGR